jgi:hypothetical protein
MDRISPVGVSLIAIAVCLPTKILNPSLRLTTTRPISNYAQSDT